MPEIGDRIRQVRKQLGLTQNEFGKRLGVSGSYIGMIENGKKAISKKILMGLMDDFRVSIDWLVLGEEIPITEELTKKYGPSATVLTGIERSAINIIRNLKRPSEQFVFIMLAEAGKAALVSKPLSAKKKEQLAFDIRNIQEWAGIDEEASFVGEQYLKTHKVKEKSCERQVIPKFLDPADLAVILRNNQARITRLIQKNKGELKQDADLDIELLKLNEDLERLYSAMTRKEKNIKEQKQ